MARLAILMSGRGSNMLAIAEACRLGELDASVELVISNRPQAPGLAAARDRGLTVEIIDHTEFASRRDFDDALHQRLVQANPDWLVLAGFMRILTAEFVARWEGRILNIHPSLLPLYPGLDTHARAIAAGDAYAGASVHVVSSELDAGPLITQVRIPVLPDDTADSLAGRVLAQEHELYVRALRLCIERDRNSLDSSPCPAPADIKTGSSS